ncbi:MAG: response regulator [Myxococcota bacterium]|mgnify:CR=1 FL=1
MASVLVVDDDRLNQKLLSQVCVDLGLDVRQAADGIEALEALRESPADLMLLDLTMPRLDGFGVLEALQRGEAPTPKAVVIVTGGTDVEGKLRGVELGAVDFIEKPFRHQALRQRIERVMSIVAMESRLLEAEAQLAALRATDRVTGTGTWGELHRVLDATFYYIQSIRHQMSCLAVSDEGYARILEQQGKEAGEERLRRISQAIQSRLREGDRVFRLDMAEFVVLLPGTSADGARIVLDKIRIATSQLDEIRSGDLALAAASYPQDDIQQASQLFRATTMALAQARSQLDEQLTGALV